MPKPHNNKPTAESQDDERNSRPAVKEEVGDEGRRGRVLVAESKQRRIIRELDVRPVTENYSQEIERVVSFIISYVEDVKFCRALILGISGGQDSTLTGKLCQIAVDHLNRKMAGAAEGGGTLPEGERRYKFVAVRLPYGEQADEEDCQKAIDFIKPNEVVTVNIKDAVDASCRSLEAAGIKISDFAKGNEKARERMKAQYSVASYFQGLVVGTDHAAEAVTGFFTKYGDGGTDLNPLHGLTKRQGRKMLEKLKCPKQLYEKIPTADLEDNRPGLPDEVALGLSYDDIDNYLEGREEVSDSVRERIEHLYDQSAHKRKLPATPPPFWTPSNDPGGHFINFEEN